MKTERRHQLETNALADRLGHLIERLEPYSTPIVGVVVAIVLIVVTYLYLSSQTKTKAAEGWNRYLAATLSLSGTDPLGQLEEVAAQYDGTPAGDWARLRMADIQLSNAIDELFRDRASANEQLRQAADNYRQVSEQADDDLLIKRALLGLGQTHESLDELDDARHSYQELVDRFADSTLANLAQQRLGMLDRRSTKEFYDWFVQQTPAPAPDNSPAGLNLESLPDEPPEASESGKPEATDSKSTSSAPAENDDSSASTPRDSDDSPASSGAEKDRTPSGAPGGAPEKPSESATPN